MSYYDVEDELEKMKGRVITQCYIESPTILVFKFAEGPDVKLGVAGDCCSYSSFQSVKAVNGERESATGILNPPGAFIELTETEEREQDEQDDYGDVVITTTSLFKTSSGHIEVVWTNISNGYYSGFWTCEK